MRENARIIITFHPRSELVGFKRLGVNGPQKELSFAARLFQALNFGYWHYGSQLPMKLRDEVWSLKRIMFRIVEKYAVKEGLQGAEYLSFDVTKVILDREQTYGTRFCIGKFDLFPKSTQTEWVAMYEIINAYVGHSKELLERLVTIFNEMGEAGDWKREREAEQQLSREHDNQQKQYKAGKRGVISQSGGVGTQSQS